MSESQDEDNNSGSKYVLSIDDNDLVIYRADNKYVCKNCISPKTKKTKRLLCAIKKRANLSIKIMDINNNETDTNSDNETNNNPQRLELRVIHPLYDDDLYIMYDKDIASIMYESESALDSLSICNNNKHNKNEDNKKPLCYIYVLFLEQNKYYVGKSLKPMARTGDHLASTVFDSQICGGSGWTRMYPPIKILEITPSYDEFDEDKFTLKYMQNKGIDNVRGGSFCELNLSRENVVTLEKMLAGASDKCYYCGSGDHYVNVCPQKNMRRVAQKQRKTTIKAKDMPKSKILKYYGTTQLLKNSNLKSVKEESSDEDDNNTSISDSTKKSVSNDNNDEEFKSFQCRYCNKSFTSARNRNNHENLLCTKSSKVIKGRLIEADVDAILEANKKYIKNKDDKKKR
jgi:hypothetical protein